MEAYRLELIILIEVEREEEAIWEHSFLLSLAIDYLFCQSRVALFHGAATVRQLRASAVLQLRRIRSTDTALARISA